MKYLFSAVALLILVACGGAGNKKGGSAEETPAAIHYHTECTGNHDHVHDHDHHGDHDHSAHTHGECNGDHDHDQNHASYDHSGHSHGDMIASSEGHTDDPDEIIFTSAQAAAAGVVVRKAERGSFREVTRVSGVVSAARGEQVSVVAPAAGIVSFGKRFTEGSAVSAGATLFTVSSGRVSGGDELAVNRAAYFKAQTDLERARRLSEDNIVSRAELEALEAEYKSARAAYESLTDAGGDRGAAVPSPIGGYIYGIEVGEGDYVETGQLLATVVRDREMELHAEVPQRYYTRLAGVSSANFRLAGSPETYNVTELGGNLVSVGRGIQTGRPFIPVVFRFGYRPGILPGSYAEVNLLGAERNGVLSLPVGAVTEQQGLHYVYIRTGADVYRRREVRLGGNDGRRVEIVSGIAEGETVVVEGAVNIRMASASGAIPHGHEH